MKITTTPFLEHQSAGQEQLWSPAAIRMGMLVPGASTCCYGTSSTSCCATFSPVPTP
jgi:hypothetical protein